MDTEAFVQWDYFEGQCYNMLFIIDRHTYLDTGKNTDEDGMDKAMVYLKHVYGN